MRKNTKNFVEDLITDYPKIPRYIEMKKQSIKYPVSKNRDENVGGGKSNIITIPNEQYIIKIDDCEFISHFEHQFTAIYDALDKFDKDFNEVIEEFYFNENNTKTLAALGFEHGYSTKAIYAERNKLFNAILKNLNLEHLAERDAIVEERKKMEKNMG